MRRALTLVLLAGCAEEAAPRLTIPDGVRAAVIVSATANAQDVRLWRAEDAPLHVSEETSELELAYFDRAPELLELSRDADGRLALSAEPDAVPLPPPMGGARLSEGVFLDTDGRTPRLVELRVAPPDCPPPNITARLELDRSLHAEGRIRRYAAIGDVLLAGMQSDAGATHLLRFEGATPSRVVLPPELGSDPIFEVLSDGDRFLVLGYQHAVLSLTRVSLDGAATVLWVKPGSPYSPVVAAHAPGGARIYALEEQAQRLLAIEVATGTVSIVAEPRGLRPPCIEDHGVVRLLGPDEGAVVLSGNLPMRFDARGAVEDIVDLPVAGVVCKADYVRLDTGAEAVSYRSPTLSTTAGESRLLWRRDAGQPWQDVPSAVLYEDMDYLDGVPVGQTRTLGELIRVHHAESRLDLPPRACAAPALNHVDGVRLDGRGAGLALLEQKTNGLIVSSHLYRFVP